LAESFAVANVGVCIGHCSATESWADAHSGSAHQPFQRAQLRCRCRCRRRRRCRNSRLPTAVRQLASWPVLRRLLLRRCQT